MITDPSLMFGVTETVADSFDVVESKNEVSGNDWSKDYAEGQYEALLKTNVDPELNAELTEATGVDMTASAPEPPTVEDVSDAEVALAKEGNPSWINTGLAALQQASPFTYNLGSVVFDAAFAPMEADFQGIDPQPFYKDISDKMFPTFQGKPTPDVAEDRLNYISEKLAVVDNVLLAPFLEGAVDPEALPHEKAMQVLKASGQSIKHAVDYNYGDEPRSYGSELVEQRFPDANPTGKAVASLLLDAFGNPLTALGGALAVSKGLKAAAATKNVDDIVAEGLASRGIREAAAEAEIPEEELTDLLSLANDVQKGKEGAMEKFSIAVENHPEVMKSLQRSNVTDTVEDFGNTIKQADEVLGSPNDDLYSIDIPDIGGTIDIRQTMIHTNDPVFNVEVNLSKIDSGKDADLVIADLSNIVQREIDGLQLDPAGLVDLHDLQKAKLENFIGGKVGYMDTKDLMAYRQYFISSAARLQKTAAEARDLSSGNFSVLAYDKLFYLHKHYIETVTGKYRGADRVLESMQISAKSRPEKARQLKNALETSLGDPLVTSSIKRLNKLGAAENKGIRQFLSKVRDPSAQSRAIQSTTMNKVTGSLFERFTNSLLGGWDTQLTNFNSSVAMLLGNPSRRMVMAMERGIMLDYAGATKQSNAALKSIMGAQEGVRDAVRLMSHQTDWDSLGIPADMLNVHDISKQRLRYSISSSEWNATGFLGGFLDVAGRMIRIPGATVQAMDKGFKITNYRASVHEQAYMMSKAMGKTPEEVSTYYKTLKNNPTEEMMAEAVADAKAATFTEDYVTPGQGEFSWSGAGQVTRQMINRIPFLRYVFPFHKSMNSMANSGVRNSFVGNIWSAAKGDMMKPGEAGMQARAKFYMGTAMPVALVSVLPEDGITGHVAYGSPEWAFSEMPPYSIRTGFNEDGTVSYFEYGRYEPLRAVLGMVVNYRQALGNFEFYDEYGNENPLMQEMASVVIAPFMQTVTDTFMLDGFAKIVQIIESWTDVKQGGEQAVEALTDIAVSMTVGNTIGSANKIFFDDTIRISEGYFGGIKSKIMGLSSDLPADVHYYGFDRYRDSNIPVPMMSSFYDSRVPKDGWDQKFENIGVTLPKIPDFITIDNVTLTLTPDQKNRYGKIRGLSSDGADPIKLRMIDAYVAYEHLTDDELLTEVRLVMQDRTEDTKWDLFDEDPSLQRQFAEKTIGKEIQDIKKLRERLSQ